MSKSAKTAHAHGLSLAKTLMVCIVVFQAENGEFGAMPTSDYDGDPAAIIHEFDPFQP